jgi:hypothetical protein
MFLPKFEQAMLMYEGSVRFREKHELPTEVPFKHPFLINGDLSKSDPVTLAFTTPAVHPSFNYERLEFWG